MKPQKEIFDPCDFEAGQADEVTNLEQIKKYQPKFYAMHKDKLEDKTIQFFRDGWALKDTAIINWETKQVIMVPRG